MHKRERHLRIRELLSRQVIGRQEELARALEEEGFKVTQATLSRDLQEMGIVRVRTADGFRYVVPTEGSQERLRRIVQLEVTSIQSNEHLIVVKTLSGHAQAVAVYLDQLENAGILGTVAGDDTILVVPASVRNTAEVLERIRRVLGSPNKIGDG